MLFSATTATRKVAAMTKRIRAVQGGTSASKTVSILLYLIHMAQTDTSPTVTSVVSESLPHLKRGAMRDFLAIMEGHGYFSEACWNRSDFIYTFPTGSRIEFFGADSPDKVRGPRRERLFMNECFPAGTLVDGRPIEEISEGDYVTTFDFKAGTISKKRVVRTVKLASPDSMLLVMTCYGAIIGTHNHPIMTSEGWKRLDGIKKGDRIYALPFLRELYCGARHEAEDKSCEIREGILFAYMLGEVQGGKEQGEGEGSAFTDALGRGEGKGVENAAKAWNRTRMGKGRELAWGKREGFDGSAGEASQRARTRVGSGASDKDGEEGAALEVHSGFGEPVPDGCSGVRREYAPFAFDKDEGPPEDGVLGTVGVEGVEVLERKDYGGFGFSDGGDFVYCLETEVDHNFFADGFLVHNCNNVPFDAFDQLEVRTKEFVFLDWNPTREFWFYTDVSKRDDVEHLKLTYLDNEALPSEIRASIEQRRNNARWWKVYGEGELGESEGRIYKDWLVIDELPHEARLERYGLDFGYTNDPTAVVAAYRYNGGFIFDEILYRKGMSNKDIADILKNLPRALIKADSAEPKSIDELQSYGLSVLPCQKGPGSVSAGIQFLQGQRVSVTKRSVELIREYRNYMWLADRDGKLTNEPAPYDDHLLDAARYAVEEFARRHDEYPDQPAEFRPPSFL